MSLKTERRQLGHRRKQVEVLTFGVDGDPKKKALTGIAAIQAMKVLVDLDRAIAEKDTQIEAEARKGAGSLDSMSAEEWLAYLSERAASMSVVELEPFALAYILNLNLDREAFREWALAQRRDQAGPH